MIASDDIGSRGEAIFYALLTEFTLPHKPLFRPYFLGAKFPTLDFLVELIGTKKPGRYFFGQVKATTLGYTSRLRRLKAQLPIADTRRMLMFPAPTYVFGIDERMKQGYILSVNEGRPRKYTILPTTYPHVRENLNLLWKELNDFWIVRTWNSRAHDSEGKSVKKHEPWYISERLHALTIILLTERDDLGPVKQPRDSGLDFVVEIRDGERITGRRFGIVLSAEDVNGKPAGQRSTPEVAFPVCLFRLRADGGAEPNGKYSWAIEPVFTSAGDPRLQPNWNRAFETLDRRALDEIVACVNEWYDALTANLTV